MSNEELESQLSAMFDNELPATECELLARRLARDEQLRARWGHYAAIGACIRGEPGIRLDTTLASKVTAAIKQETVALAAPAQAARGHGFFKPWVTAVAGLGSAAAVAAMAIFWMRAQGPAMIVQAPPAQHPAIAAAQVQPPPAAAAPTLATAQLDSRQTAAHRRQAREPDSYVTPAAVAQGPVLVPPTELANYIVAHSAYSGPLMRRNALSALVGGDSAVPQATAQSLPATVATGK
jgi:negative regulator of sigma E activity